MLIEGAGASLPPRFMNAIKTTLLLGVLSGILLFAGELIGGRSGVYTALMIAIGVNFFSYFFSDRMALSMYSAQPLTQTELAHELGHVVNRDILTSSIAGTLAGRTLRFSSLPSCFARRVHPGLGFAVTDQQGLRILAVGRFG